MQQNIHQIEFLPLQFKHLARSNYAKVKYDKTYSQ